MPITRHQRAFGGTGMPSAVVPLTSTPTFLRGGDKLAARVLFDNGREEEHFNGASAADLSEFLACFVTESANPRNRLGVRWVEAIYPALLLWQGIALIDTPGHRVHFSPQYGGYSQFSAAMRRGTVRGLRRSPDHRSGTGVSQTSAP